MKKITSLFLVTLIVITLVACKTTTSKTTSGTTEATNATTTATTEVTTSVSSQEPDTMSPVIKGAFNTQISVGDPFNPRQGVTAEDNVDGDVTDQIEVLGTWDVNKAGSYTVTYRVSDAAGNVKEKSITLIVKEFSAVGTLKNSHFDTDTTGWNLYAGEGGAATHSVVNGEVKIDITSIGGVNWHVQFEQLQLSLEANKLYKVTFKARSEQPRSIGVLLEDPSNSYYKYGNTVVNLTTTMETYTLNIKMGATSITTGKFAFMLGKVDANSINTTVYLDDIVMQEVTQLVDTTKPVISGESTMTIAVNSSWDNLRGISVSDDLDKTLSVDDIVVTGSVNTAVAGTYTLNYEVTDNAGNKETFVRTVVVKVINYVNTDEIVNGDFSTAESITADHVTETGWREWHHNEGQNVQFTFKNGALEVNIVELGWTEGSWSIQLQQAGIRLETGKTYKLVFDASSTVARNIDLTFKNASEFGYANTNLRLTTTTQTFEFEFKVNNETNDNMVLALSLGKVAGASNSVLTFDNFVLYQVQE